MPSKHSDSHELDSLLLTYDLQVCEPLLHIQVSPKDTQRGAEEKRRDI